MKRTLLVLFVWAALLVPVKASTVITAQLTLTNAANLTGTSEFETITITNGAASTVRTWTNSLVTPASQILVSTNNSTALARMALHFAAYPLTNTQFWVSGTNVYWRAPANTVLSVTLGTNNWGAVSYVTNTTTGATVVRVPITVESATVQTNVASGLM